MADSSKNTDLLKDLRPRDSKGKAKGKEAPHPPQDPQLEGSSAGPATQATTGQMSQALAPEDPPAWITQMMESTQDRILQAVEMRLQELMAAEQRSRSPTPSQHYSNSTPRAGRAKRRGGRRQESLRPNVTPALPIRRNSYTSYQGGQTPRAPPVSTRAHPLQQSVEQDEVDYQLRPTFGREPHEPKFRGAKLSDGLSSKYDS